MPGRGETRARQCDAWQADPPSAQRGEARESRRRARQAWQWRPREGPWSPGPAPPRVAGGRSLIRLRPGPVSPRCGMGGPTPSPRRSAPEVALWLCLGGSVACGLCDLRSGTCGSGEGGGIWAERYLEIVLSCCTRHLGTREVQVGKAAESEGLGPSRVSLGRLLFPGCVPARSRPRESPCLPLRPEPCPKCTLTARCHLCPLTTATPGT